jgi:hypothetical protein
MIRGGAEGGIYTQFSIKLIMKFIKVHYLIFLVI